MVITPISLEVRVVPAVLSGEERSRRWSDHADMLHAATCVQRGLVHVPRTQLSGPPRHTASMTAEEAFYRN